MRIILSAGGTGGHIYPALAIINKFKQYENNLEVLFIGTHNRMEKDIVPKNNIKYESLEIYGFSKSDIIRDIKNIFLISSAKKKVEKIIKEFKPDIVIATGGYVTYPVVKTAQKLHVKTFIHEQNSIPGKTNLALAKDCNIVGLSFEDSKKYFKSDNTFICGNPCSENALEIPKIDKRSLGFNPMKKLVIFVCGSLGSNSVNNKVRDYLINFDEDFEILYITGKDLYEDFIKDTTFSNKVKILPFYDNLSSLLPSANLVVTRAGASTISELLSLGIPAIYIPSPYVANNHQYYNALSIKNIGAAKMIEEKDLNSTSIRREINDIINNDEKLNIMKENTKKLAINNSSDIIYKKIKEIL